MMPAARRREVLYTKKGLPQMRTLVEQEVEEPDSQHPMHVGPRSHAAFHHNHLTEGVAYANQRSHFLLPLVRIGQHQRRLYVAAVTAVVHHEIHLELLPQHTFVFGHRALFHNPHVHAAATPSQLIVKHVLHDVRLLLLPHTEKRVAHSPRSVK